MNELILELSVRFKAIAVDAHRLSDLDDHVSDVSLGWSGVGVTFGLAALVSEKHAATSTETVVLDEELRFGESLSILVEHLIRTSDRVSPATLEAVRKLTVVWVDQYRTHRELDT